MPVIPIMPSINTCMCLTTTTTTTVTCTSGIKVPEVNTSQLQALADVCSTVTGIESITVPNIVMNSLVSPTKVITNENIPNPITSAHNAILPSIPVPVSSIGSVLYICYSPFMINTMRTTFNYQIHFYNKAGVVINNMKSSIDYSKNELDNKKLDEPMPVEEDPILEIANKTDAISNESDVEVRSINENDVIETESLEKSDEILIEVPPHDKSDELSIATMNSAEPMECASGNSMASPKHAMATDEIMLESVSVCMLTQSMSSHIP